MTQRTKTLRDVITAVTTTVLFAVILCLVVFSARGYQHSADLQDANGNTRAVLSYIAGSVRDSGSPQITIEDRSGTECLIIHGEGYEQRFYLNEGRLLEEYTEPGADTNPETALEIGKTDKLEFGMDEDGILTIRTDSGTSIVNTRRR
jgi:hypothetical protein